MRKSNTYDLLANIFAARTALIQVYVMPMVHVSRPMLVPVSQVIQETCVNIRCAMGK
jgi:hypothetical protein